MPLSLSSQHITQSPNRMTHTNCDTQTLDKINIKLFIDFENRTLIEFNEMSGCRCGCMHEHSFCGEIEIKLTVNNSHLNVAHVSVYLSCSSIQLYLY